MPQNRSRDLGVGDTDQRLRTVERFVSDHEGDLTMWARDMQRMEARLDAVDPGNRLTALEIEAATSRTERVELRRDTDSNTKEIKEVRTSIRTLVISLLMASVAFLGAAVTLIQAVAR